MRPTKYMQVDSFRKEDKEQIRRRIKLILVDHFANKGIPYENYADDRKDEVDEASDDEDDDDKLKGRPISKSEQDTDLAL